MKPTSAFGFSPKMACSSISIAIRRFLLLLTVLSIQCSGDNHLCRDLIDWHPPSL